MLFRRKIEKSCAYCEYGAMLDEETILCSKRGIRDIGTHCRKFKYDPCKRIPRKMKRADFSQFRDKDFTL